MACKPVRQPVAGGEPSGRGEVTAAQVTFTCEGPCDEKIWRKTEAGGCQPVALKCVYLTRVSPGKGKVTFNVSGCVCVITDDSKLKLEADVDKDGKTTGWKTNGKRDAYYDNDKCTKLAKVEVGLGCEDGKTVKAYVFLG